MVKEKKIVIVGATSAIAEHCARLWVIEQPRELLLVGRDIRKLDAIAADLRVRAPHTLVQNICINFRDPKQIQTLAQTVSSTGSPDIVLIAHGTLPVQADCQTDLTACEEALAINGSSPVLFAEAFASVMAPIGRGHLAIIGSVAGDRGRKSNYIYGAAKGLVTRYAQGLQHRLHGSGVHVTLIKPGPTDTPMTTSLKEKGIRLAPVEQVAKDIVQGIADNRAAIYTPGKWALVMAIIRHLPASIFNKLDI